MPPGPDEPRSAVRQFDRLHYCVRSVLERAERDGVTMHSVGQIPEGSGFWTAPTVLTGVTPTPPELPTMD